MRMSDWSSDVCSSDLRCNHVRIREGKKIPLHRYPECADKTTTERPRRAERNLLSQNSEHCGLEPVHRTEHTQSWTGGNKWGQQLITTERRFDSSVLGVEAEPTATEQLQPYGHRSRHLPNQHHNTTSPTP